MGVTGIKNYLCRDGFVFSKNFSDCTILIDGSGLIFAFLGSSQNKETNSPYYGGNYGEFDKKIRECFEKFDRCGIKCVVVLDGATPLAKYDNKRSRLERSLDNYRNPYPGTIYWNHLAREVFVNTLQELNVTLVQAPYEADDVLAFLSYRFELPILSSDSDFVFYRHPVISLTDIDNDIVDDYLEDGRPHLALRAVSPAHVRERFNINNEQYFRLAPLLIGNDIFKPLQDYNPKWRHFQSNYNGPRDRMYHIRSVFRWIG